MFDDSIKVGRKKEKKYVKRLRLRGCGSKGEEMEPGWRPSWATVERQESSHCPRDKQDSGILRWEKTKSKYLG